MMNTKRRSDAKLLSDPLSLSLTHTLLYSKPITNDNFPPTIVPFTTNINTTTSLSKAKSHLLISSYRLNKMTRHSREKQFKLYINERDGNSKGERNAESGNENIGD